MLTTLLVHWLLEMIMNVNLLFTNKTIKLASITILISFLLLSGLFFSWDVFAQLILIRTFFASYSNTLEMKYFKPNDVFFMI